MYLWVGGFMYGHHNTASQVRKCSLVSLSIIPAYNMLLAAILTHLKAHLKDNGHILYVASSNDHTIDLTFIIFS